MDNKIPDCNFSYNGSVVLFSEKVCYVVRKRGANFRIYSRKKTKKN